MADEKDAGRIEHMRALAPCKKQEMVTHDVARCYNPHSQAARIVNIDPKSEGTMRLHFPIGLSLVMCCQCFGVDLQAPIKFMGDETPLLKVKAEPKKYLDKSIVRLF